MAERPQVVDAEPAVTAELLVCEPALAHARTPRWKSDSASASADRRIAGLGALAVRQLADERRNRPGRRDAGRVDSRVQDARGAQRIAHVLERHEAGARAFGRRPVALRRGGEQRLAQPRRHAAGAGRESRQSAVSQVHDRGPLAHPADDAPSIDALEQRVEVRVLRRIGPDDRVLDRADDARLDEPRHGVESGDRDRGRSCPLPSDTRRAERPPHRQSHGCRARGRPRHAGRRTAAASRWGSAPSRAAAPDPSRGRMRARGLGWPRRRQASPTSSQGATRTPAR